MEHLDSTGGVYDLTLLEKTDERMVFRGSYMFTYNASQYLGAILTIDRSVVWANTTRPLP